MSVVTVSDTIIHVYLAHRRCILQLSPSEAGNNVVEASVCASGDTQQALLFSRDGLARTVMLSSYKVIIPTDVFRCPSSKVLGPIVHIGSSIGCIQSVASLPNLCSHPQSMTCSCRVVACGSQGYAEVSLDNTHLVNIHMWSKRTEAVARVVFLPSGRLRGVVVSPPTPCFIAVTMAGAVRAVSGTQLTDAVSPATQIAHMMQAPAGCVANPSLDIVVVTGCFGSILALYANIYGHIGVHRITVTGDPRNLAPTMRFLHDESVIVEYRPCRTAVQLRYDAQSSKVIARHDTGSPSVLLPITEKKSDLGSSIRCLLRSISAIADLHATAAVDQTALQRLLSSYNSALLFVIQSKRQMTPVSSISKTNTTLVQCHFSLTDVPAPNSPQFESLLPVSGRPVFLTASLQNPTRATMSHGWALHVRVAEGPCYTQRGPLAEIISRNLHSSDDSAFSGPHGSTIREMCAPLENVEPGTSIEISFPFSIDSHRPLFITSSLNFRHPEFTNTISADNVDIQVVLSKDMELDIFDMIVSREGLPTTRDKSYKWLSNARTMKCFDPKGVEKRHAHPLSQRLQLPLSLSTVLRILKMDNPVNHFKTVLNAQFSVSFEEVPQPVSLVDGEGNGASIATILSVEHVLPFVRAAILARVVSTKKKIMESRTEAEQSTFSVPFVQIHGASNIDQWQRSVLDKSGNWRQHERNAESAQVDARRVCENIIHDRDKDGRPNCSSDDARTCLARSLVEAQSAYNEWRLKIEDIWTPEGVRYPSNERIDSDK